MLPSQEQVVQLEKAMGGTQDDETASSIETQFEGRWGVWQSTSGTWWAARRHALTAAEQSGGCVAYLRGRSLAELRRFMQEQDQLRLSVLDTCSPRRADEQQERDPLHAHSTDDLASLQEEFPGFGIWREVTGKRVRYIAQRTSIDAGLHAVVALDIVELRAILQAGSTAQSPGGHRCNDQATVTPRPGNP